MRTTVTAMDTSAYPPVHLYTSTACVHGLHSRCRLSCKFCLVPCLCPCHSHPEARSLLQAIHTQLAALAGAIATLTTQEKRVMSTIIEVKKFVADLKDETDAIATKLDAQAATIADLKAKIAAGSAVTQQDLDELGAGLAPISAKLKAMGTDPTDPMATGRED